MDCQKRKDCIKVLNIILECLLSWFAPILSFTTEEIFKLINKDEESSIHLKKFVNIPKNVLHKKIEKRVERMFNNGAVKEVKNGYARNYLFPKKMALRNNKANLEYYEKMCLNS